VGEAAAHPWGGLVRERGGVPVESLADAAGLDPAVARFVVVLCHDRGILPAVARLTPEQAAALLITLDLQGGADAGVANRLSEGLAAAGTAAYLLKAGAVGAGDRRGPSLEVEPGDVEAILDAIAAGSIGWERDPDFGYELATEMEGIDHRRMGLLVPRFFFARTDRVYKHAALVPRAKEERRRRLERIDGLAPEIVAAVA
jgi:phosphoenolpyruvate carboxykinase (ATP)